MRLAFYKAWQKKATWIDYIIAIASLGKYSHVELVFSNGDSFSSSPRDGGCRFKRINFDATAWDFIELNVGMYKEIQIRKKAEKFIGKPYDFIGAIFSVTPLCIQLSKRIFCVEAVVDCISPLYRHRLKDGCKYTLQSFYNNMEELLVELPVQAPP